MITRMIAPVSLAIALAAGTAAYAEDQPQKPEPDPDAVTCKTATVVDSKIPQRICMTNFEWADRRRAQEEAQRGSRNRNSSCGAGPC